MTYAVGGTIQAGDYNTFATAAANIGPIYNIGTSDYGYGQLSNGQTTIQTVSSAVAPTGYVTAAQWNILISALNSSRLHQIGGSWTNVSPFGNNVATNTGLSTDGVIHATVDQGGTLVSFTTLTAQADAARRDAVSQGTSSTNTSTNNTSWRDSLTFTCTISWGSADRARYFFNAGGQIGVSMSHGPSTPNTINPLIQNLCNGLGTIWLSSGTCTLAGTSYTGLTAVGGSSATRTINTGLSFYALTGSNQQGVRQGAGITYDEYSSTFLTLNYRYAAPSLVITAVIDEVWTAGTGTFVGTPTNFNLITRLPETTYLTDSWGTPSVSTTITTT